MTLPQRSKLTEKSFPARHLDRNAALHLTGGMESENRSRQFRRVDLQDLEESNIQSLRRSATGHGRQHSPIAQSVERAAVNR